MVAGAKGSIEIMQFMHCKKCVEELPKGESPKNYARLSAGWTKLGIQIWCVRHEMNVVHIDFMGQKVQYAKPIDKR